MCRICVPVSHGDDWIAIQAKLSKEKILTPRARLRSRLKAEMKNGIAPFFYAFQLFVCRKRLSQVSL